MTYVIAQPCVDLKDKACIEECPVDCIYEGKRSLYIHPDECVDCGACEPVCPVEAIYYEDDVPEQWKPFYDANVEFFSELGSPGGAAKTGALDYDHPVVAALPPRARAADLPVTGLPDFPWDALAPYAERARAHPGGIVDLSVGTPVDSTPAVLQQALADAGDAPGYPTVAGTPAVHLAVGAWFERVRGTGPLPGLGVMPVVGSKELVAWLPTLLGLGAGDVVVHPEVAYPTYDVGARLAGARPVPADSTTALGPDGTVRLVWLNSPGNPTGRVLPVEHLAKVVAWARARGAVVASDECYSDLGWSERWDPEAGGERVPSLLDPRVTGGDLTGVLAVCSASKRSNLAGYRAAFVAGDPVLVQHLVQVRKHAGMIVPAPVQAVLAASLSEDSHVAEQKARYRARREVLLPALEAAGLRVEDSEAGLYLWATPSGGPATGEGGASRPSDCWSTVGRLADLGVLVAPGSFYGARGLGHVRVALTASDERIRAAADRLGDAGSGTSG